MLSTRAEAKQPRGEVAALAKQREEISRKQAAVSLLILLRGCRYCWKSSSSSVGGDDEGAMLVSNGEIFDPSAPCADKTKSAMHY